MGSTTARAVHNTLRLYKVPEHRIPPQFRDVVVKKSKKDKMGQIVVRQHSGVVQNTAHKALAQFEKNVGGREEIVEKLEALYFREGSSKGLQRLSEALRGKSKKSLSRIVADCDCSPLEVMDAYARACIALAQVECAIEAHRNLPTLYKDLVRHAIDQEGLCPACVGTGTQRRRSKDHKETQVCIVCSGSGKSLKVSDHKQFAARQLLEVTKQVDSGKGPTINVNQAVGIKMGEGGSFFEKMVGAADEALYGRKKAPDIIEADIVEEEQ